MKTRHAVLVASALLALALPAAGQVRYGGYIGLEYIDGQAESDYPQGSVENLLAGFLVSGQIGGKFGFGIEARMLDATSFDLNEAWAGFLPSESFTVRAGLFLVPFGSWNRASRPHETILIRTPLNLEYLYPASWRDLGVLVEGQAGVLTYAAYLGNGLAESDALGAGQQFSDNNADKAKGGRLGLLAGQAIRAGVSYYTGKMDDQEMLDLVLEGVDLAWVTRNWEIHGEYTRALVDNPEPYERGESEGYFIWTAMSFKSFQPVGSYQKVKYFDPYHGGGIDLEHSRWSAGLRFVLSSTLFIKGEYDWNTEKGIALKNNQLQVQLGLSF